jgi:hypothetical protein
MNFDPNSPSTAGIPWQNLPTLCTRKSAPQLRNFRLCQFANQGLDPGNSLHISDVEKR